jgi:spermidine synthase
MNKKTPPKHPNWKIWLSYLFPQHLESVSSKYSPVLEVSLRRGRHELSSTNAIYSFDDLYANFAEAFKKIPLNELPGDEVLVLGLGLGSIPYLLEKKMGLKFHYTMVEIDEAVIGLAEKYTLCGLDCSYDIICGDAEIYAASIEEQYDLICMDVFQDDVIPGDMQGEEFLENLKTGLTPGGLLLYNVLSLRRHDRKQAEKYYHKVFKKVFPNASFLEVASNWVLIARKEGGKEVEKLKS